MWYFKKTTRQLATNLYFYIGGKGTCEELGVGYLKKGLLLLYLFGKFNLHPKLLKDWSSYFPNKKHHEKLDLCLHLSDST